MYFIIFFKQKTKNGSLNLNFFISICKLVKKLVQMKESKNKNFDLEIKIIEQFENYKQYKITLENGFGEAFITKSKKDYHLFYNGVFPYSADKKIKILIEGKSITLKSTDFQKSINQILAKNPAQHTFDIDGVYKGNLKDSSFFKMFFFDDSERKNIFHYILEKAKNDGITPWAFGCIRLNIMQKRYDITQHHNGENSYFIIENLDAATFEEFNEDSYAIQKGIGFLIGYMPGGENYIFSGENFIYRRLSRNSLKSIFHPVTSNPYSKLNEGTEKEIADQYYGKLKVIPVPVISELITQLRQNMDFSVAIIFLMEVASLKSIVSMPGVFSVILESFANIIITKQNKQEKLITDKDLVTDIIYDMNTVIDKHAKKIHPNAEIKIRRKINEINKPVNFNRLTNAEKLRAPFDHLKIKLSEAEEKAIDYRNYLLHGNILMHNETERTSEEIDNHMLHVSAKLYTLISKLILKSCGYEGYVINHSKLFEQNNIDSTEEYFEHI